MVHSTFHITNGHVNSAEISETSEKTDLRLQEIKMKLFDFAKSVKNIDSTFHLELVNDEITNLYFDEDFPDDLQQTVRQILSP